MRYILISLLWVASLLIVANHHVLSAGATPAGSPYSRFVGSWSHHDGGITIQSNGYGFNSFRTFTWCNMSRGPFTACDRTIGNGIYGGGFTAFTLNRVSGNTAYGTVYNSSYSWDVATKVRVVLNPTNDTITLHGVGRTFPGCGPRAPAGFCGA